MSRIKKITISLSAEMLVEIKAAVAAGEYTNTSEAVRDALRGWRRQRTVIALNDQDLRRLVAEGLKSGEPVDGEVVLQRLRRKYATLAPQDAWSASWSRTNRLLVGPFASFARAKELEAKLKAAGADVFAWKSDAGEVVEKLPGD